MEKKKSIFQKVKDYWKSIPQYDRDWIKLMGVFGLETSVITGAIVTTVMDKRRVKDMTIAYQMGTLDGQMNAYRDMAQNPYRMMDTGMKVLDKQGKVTHF